MTASDVVTLKVDHPFCAGNLFHGASDAPRAAMRASDSKSHAVLFCAIAVRALTEPHSMEDCLTSRQTPSRGRAEGEREKRISSAAGVL